MLEIIIIIAGLLLDQGTKSLAQSALPALPQSSYPLIEGVFHFTYLENRGAAFGMLEGMLGVFVAVMIVASVAIGYMLIFKRKTLDIWTRVSLALILAGALGNFIDRVVFGYVRDFLHFALINFAVFNIADACITIGTIIFAVYVLFIADKKPAAPAPECAIEGAIEGAIESEIQGAIQEDATQAQESFDSDSV